MKEELIVDGLRAEKTLPALNNNKSDSCSLELLSFYLSVFKNHSRNK
jgi:hypothetical protein